MTQSQRILAHMKRRSITPMDALNLYGCMRLAARINELREAGHDIETKRERHAGGKHARYFLRQQ